MMIPAVTLLAKNSWLMPRKIAFSAPSMLFADAASAAERSVVLDLSAGDLRVGRRDEAADAAVGEVERADQEDQRDEVERERERRHLPGADEHGGQRAVQDRGEARPDDDPDHHQDVPVGLQEQRQPGADEHAVEAEQPGPDRAAIHPDPDRGQVRDDEAEDAREAEPRLGDDHRHEDRQPRHRVVHEADLPDAAQAVVDEVERGLLSTRAAQAGIVPLIDRPPGEALPEVLIGVAPFGRRRAAPAMRAQSTPRPSTPPNAAAALLNGTARHGVKVAKAALLRSIAARCGPAAQRAILWLF